MLSLIPISYFFSHSISIGIFSRISNECFYDGDIVLIKNPKNKKTYAATIVINEDFIKKSDKTNISIYDGEVIEIPTEYIAKILDN